MEPTRVSELIVNQTWDGQPIDADERARVTLEQSREGLRVEVHASFHGDPPPPNPPGSTDRLWEYEVVELFLLGTEQQYLELELGPHGHYLALRLRGPRNLEESGLALEYQARLKGDRWTGRAQLPSSYLPASYLASGPTAANAYAIHGQGSRRRYLAAHPVPGPHPDFHRLGCFRPLVWKELNPDPEDG